MIGAYSMVHSLEDLRMGQRGIPVLLFDESYIVIKFIPSAIIYAFQCIDDYFKLARVHFRAYRIEDLTNLQ